MNPTWFILTLDRETTVDALAIKHLKMRRGWKIVGINHHCGIISIDLYRSFRLGVFDANR